MSKVTSLSFQETLFDWFVIITYIFYTTTFVLGLGIINPSIFFMVDKLVKLYIGVFLAWRYNPYGKLTTLSSLDRKLAFHAGLFIIVTIALRSIMEFMIPQKDAQWEQLSDEFGI